MENLELTRKLAFRNESLKKLGKDHEFQLQELREKRETREITLKSSILKKDLGIQEISSLKKTIEGL